MDSLQTDNESRLHRCLHCGQIKPESELYYGDRDWSCVDPGHGGFENAFERTPSKLDYKELTETFARTLFAWQFPDLAPSVYARPEMYWQQVGEWIRDNRTAYYVLQSLVATAVRSRSRWGMTQRQRDEERFKREMEVQRVMSSLGSFRGIATEPYESEQQKPQAYQGPARIIDSQFEVDDE